MPAEGCPSADIIAPGDLPEFRRSTVDGFAVISADTHGASESIPLYLDLVGDIPVGTMAERPLKSGEATRVVTGGMIPEGSDAVVMVEHADLVDEKTLEIRRAAAPSRKPGPRRRGRYPGQPSSSRRPVPSGPLTSGR